ncbi:hypothetical protein D3OALGA1CA_4612 [Olavius algarvensis associated proteobacterium Delta 3]|nr:hypothetical protein D3OALGA1CA_4612 [Olavius algarvensis associated proteobacterium Delta 3]
MLDITSVFLHLIKYIILKENRSTQDPISFKPPHAPPPRFPSTHKFLSEKENYDM